MQQPVEFVNHISDHDLERYYLGMVKDEAELASLAGLSRIAHVAVPSGYCGTSTCCCPEAAQPLELVR